MFITDISLYTGDVKPDVCDVTADELCVTSHFLVCDVTLGTRLVTSRQMVSDVMPDVGNVTPDVRDVTLLPFLSGKRLLATPL